VLNPTIFFFRRIKVPPYDFLFSAAQRVLRPADDVLHGGGQSPQRPKIGWMVEAVLFPPVYGIPCFS